MQTSGDIYNQLCARYKNMVVESIKNYNDIYNEYLILMAELEAGIYIKICSVNEDSHGEREGKRLQEELRKAEENLKNVIDIYERIDKNKDKIMSSLNILVEQRDRHIKTIVNEIKTGEFSY